MIYSNRSNASSRNWLRPLFLSALAGMFAVMVASATADGLRTSASYSMQFDAITDGGGENSSASYRQPESAVGDNFAWGISSSASYSMQTGGVLWGTFVPVTLSRFEAE